jgi:hypothetical protein
LNRQPRPTHFTAKTQRTRRGSCLRSSCLGALRALAVQFPVSLKRLPNAIDRIRDSGGGRSSGSDQRRTRYGHGIRSRFSVPGHGRCSPWCGGHPARRAAVSPGGEWSARDGSPRHHEATAAATAAATGTAAGSATAGSPAGAPSVSRNGVAASWKPPWCSAG